MKEVAFSGKTVAGKRELDYHMKYEDQRALWSEHLAMLFARRRCNGSVYMDGSHNPLPSELRESRNFIDDLIDSLEGKL
jgi:hypothetical protein